MKSKNKIILIILLISLPLRTFAASVPALTGCVVDNAGVMKSNDKLEVEKYLKSIEDATGIQIAVLTVPGLDGESITSYSMKVAEKWQLGQKGKDNGALLLVAMAEHEVRIEVGYGLEGVLTDTKCGRIIRNEIVPEFKSGDYSKGILKGVRSIGGVASGEIEINEESEDFDSTVIGLIVGSVFMIIWLFFFFVVITSRSGIFKWVFLSRMLGNGNHRHTTYTPTFTSHPSGFSGGGFSGGGFSGGGGHFGGGGASGHW